MALENIDPTWTEVLRDYLFHLKAGKAPKTVRFYETQLRQLIRWADENAIPFDRFGKRHLDRYLAERAQKVSRTTLRHDAVAAKAMFKWAARNDFLDRSPLAEYEIHRAPRPNKYMPGEEDIRSLLESIPAYWDVSLHPEVRHNPPLRRVMHRDRNYAILLLLVDSACRIGEALNLRLEDWQPKERQFTIRESKGKEPRTLPVSPAVIEAVTAWLRIRAKLMSNATEDEGYLFVTEYGTKVDESIFLKAVKSILRWAKLSDEITLHSLRRYSLNRLAKSNLLAAQSIAGHKSPQTTLIYTKLDPDFIREAHGATGALDAVLSNRRQARRKKLL